MSQPEESRTVLSQLDTLHCSMKKTRTQRRTRCVCSAYCSRQNGTFQEEVTLNSEKNKLIALSIVELCLAESIRKFS